jgi:hypothetical protein
MAHGNALRPECLKAELRQSGHSAVTIYASEPRDLRMLNTGAVSRIAPWV